MDSLLDKLYQKVEDIETRLKAVDSYMNRHVRKVSKVITPPDESEFVPGMESEAKREPRVLARFKTLLYLLAGMDIELNPDHVTAEGGAVKKNMVREKGYVSVTVPELNRIVLVCDEEENASFVFKLNQVEADELLHLKKSQLKELIASKAGIGRQINQFPNWKDIMEECLVNDAMFQKQERVETREGEHGKVITGELEEWKNFWEAPSGEHYGSAFAIWKKIRELFGVRISKDTWTGILKEINIPKLTIITKVNQVESGYCYEHFTSTSEFQKLKEQAKVRREALESMKEYQETGDGGYVDSQGNH